MPKFEKNWLDDRSDDAVIDEIKRVAKLVDAGKLTKSKFNKLAHISASAVERRFSSWSNALRRAGLDDAPPVYSASSALDDIQRVGSMFPDSPFTSTLYERHGRYSASYVVRKFSSWKEALEAAGIGSRYVGPLITPQMRTQPGRHVSNAQIVEAIQDIHAKLGRRALSAVDIESNSDISSALMNDRFGSISGALRAAGVEQVAHGRRHTESDVFENLSVVWTHYGRAPTVPEMRRPPSSIGPDTYLHRFGGWRKALSAFLLRVNSEDDEDSDPSENHGQLTDDQGLEMNVEHTDSRAPRDDEPSVLPASAKQVRETIKPQDRRNPGSKLRMRVLFRDNFTCKLCGRGPHNTPDCVIHADHILPFSKGGKTIEENLRALCADCNLGRGNQLG